MQILAKADMRIVALYDQQLVHGDGEEELGRMLRRKFCETQEAVLQVLLSTVTSLQQNSLAVGYTPHNVLYARLPTPS